MIRPKTGHLFVSERMSDRDVDGDEMRNHDRVLSERTLRVYLSRSNATTLYLHCGPLGPGRRQGPLGHRIRTRGRPKP